MRQKPTVQFFENNRKNKFFATNQSMEKSE